MIKTPLQTVILVFLVLVGASSACLAQELTTEVRPSWWTSLPTTPLFTTPAGGGELPAGWSVIGGPAKFDFVNDAKGRLELRGTGSAPRNAFLTSPNSYGDFLLEFEVFMEKDGGNSGVQIRSTVDGSRMFGYQIEIDPSDRAWSAGLYDEGRPARGTTIGFWRSVLGFEPGSMMFPPSTISTSWIPEGVWDSRFTPVDVMFGGETSGSPILVNELM